MSKQISMQHVEELPDVQKFIILAHKNSGGFSLIGSSSTWIAAERLALSGLDAHHDWTTVLTPVGLYIKEEYA